MSGSTVRKRQRRKLKFFIAQQGRCWLCGEAMRMDVHQSNPDFASWDHVTPKSMGGSNRQDNLMLAHRKCNGARGNKIEVRAIDHVEMAGAT